MIEFGRKTMQQDDPCSPEIKIWESLKNHWKRRAVTCETVNVIDIFLLLPSPQLVVIARIAISVAGGCRASAYAGYSGPAYAVQIKIILHFVGRGMGQLVLFFWRSGIVCVWFFLSFVFFFHFAWIDAFKCSSLKFS